MGQQKNNRSCFTYLPGKRTVLIRSKYRELDEKEEVQEEPISVKQEIKSTQRFKKFEVLENTNNQQKIGIIGKSTNVSLIDIDDNCEIQTQSKIAQSDLMNFNNILPSQPSKKNQSSFSFIKKSEISNHPNSARDSMSSNINFTHIDPPHSISTNNLIDLTSSENLKDVKFKETTSNIFKLYNEPSNSTSSNNQNNLNFNSFIDKNNFNNPQTTQPIYFYNRFNQPTSNYNNNSNLFLNDLYNKSTPESKLGASFTIDPVSLKTNHLDNKNHDPFKGLVNFK